MSDMAFDHITDKEDSEQDTDGRIDQYEQIATHKSRDIELQEPPVGDMNQRLEDDCRQARHQAHHDAERQKESPVADMAFAPHDKPLVYISKSNHLTLFPY